MAAATSELQVVLTEGAVKNGYLRVPEELKGCVDGGRNGGGDVTLDLEGFGTVDGAIDTARGTFRWRGWRKFYRLHSLRAGDRVAVAQVSAGHYRVAPVRVRLLELEPEGSDREERKAAASLPETARKRRPVAKGKRCNELDGTTWLQYSLSVWSDIRKSAEEQKLGHPAMFPAALVDRLIRTFMRAEDRVVLDPFMGSGSVLVAARNCGKHGIGFEISSEYVDLARRRLRQDLLTGAPGGNYEIRTGDARSLLARLEPSSIDLCITSPPYWDILNQRRTADSKAIRHYGNLPGDLGTIASYEEFMSTVGGVFGQVLAALREGAYCCVVVMDLRKQDRFYPLHADLARELQSRGYEFDDIIIWDRAHEYNNLRPLGYPYRFRVNKIHEYVLIFRKASRPR